MNWDEIFAAATPELYLAFAGLVAVVLGAVLRERFATVSIKAGALILLGASALSLFNLSLIHI